MITFNPELVAAVQKYEELLKVQTELGYVFGASALSFKAFPNPTNFAHMNEKAAELVLAAAATDNAKAEVDRLNRTE